MSLLVIPTTVGSDRVRLVLRHDRPVLDLARVDAEVVEPGVRQHFFQVPVALDRAQES